MSGNSDDQPISESERAERIVRDILDPSHTRHTISPSGQLYRLIERYNSRHAPPSQTHPHELAPPSRPPISQHQIPHMPPSYPPPYIPPFVRSPLNPPPPLPTISLEQVVEQEMERRQRYRRASGDDVSPLFVLPPQPQPPPPGPIPRRRHFSSVSSRRGRVRSSFNPSRSSTGADEPGAASSLIDLQNATRQLDQASSNLRAHLEIPLPRVDLQYHATGAPFGHLPDAEESSHNRRAKRRKVEMESTEDKFTGFRYGKYGQVEAGKLKMEIVSCDGGIYQEGPYTAENVLRTDDTVYCTKSNRCNLVLRHQGATVFSLTELIIKAPHSGYTAPVQEGMVFVSMTSDDLLSRTARYQIQYSPPRNRSANSERPDDLPSIMSIRHNRDGSAQARAGRLYEIGMQDEECDFRTAQIPPDFTSNSLPFQVTTECSDSEEEGFSPSWRSNPIASSPYDPDSSDEESFHPSENYLMNEIRSHRGHHVPIPRRETASTITLAEAVEASQLATQEAIRAVGGELMVPHAKFFIQRDKSKCRVRFDPPVSGRFILLKMWSPHQNPLENIDVQSVVAKGFAGPRFIPEITLMR